MNHILKVNNRIIPMSAAYDKIMYDIKLVNDTTILIKRETPTIEILHNETKQI
jgi:hypothetical protein